MAGNMAEIASNLVGPKVNYSEIGSRRLIPPPPLAGVPHDGNHVLLWS